MKQCKKGLNERNFTLDGILIFEELLNALLIFLVFYLLLTFFNFYPLAALGPSIAYFVFFIYVKMQKKDKARLVESHYDLLKEKLRTARDNAAVENPIVDELEKEVIGDMKQVRVSSFINTKEVSWKITISIVLCFLIVLIAVLNVDIASLSSSMMMEKLMNRTLLKGKGDVSVELNISEDIYGDDSVAQLGDNELSIKIRPSNYKVSVREGGDIERRQFDETFPSEVFVESSVVYEENIPKEQQELVKAYYEKLKG
jgi:hypothetical protein